MFVKQIKKIIIVKVTGPKSGSPVDPKPKAGTRVRLVRADLRAAGTLPNKYQLNHIEPNLNITNKTHSSGENGRTTSPHTLLRNKLTHDRNNNAANLFSGEPPLTVDSGLKTSSSPEAKEEK